jgi:phosphoribosylformylglycinamidine synthase
MSKVRRVYVEKKPAFAVKAKELQAEIKSYLGISSVTGVRELIRYDIENISEETYKKALVTVSQSPFATGSFATMDCVSVSWYFPPNGM